jgi:hypothetical protein
MRAFTCWVTALKARMLAEEEALSRWREAEEKRLKDWEDELRKLREALEKLKAELEARLAEIEARERALNEREALLNQRLEDLNRREQELNEREAALHARAAALDEREAGLDSREAMLQQRENDLNTREAMLEMRENAVSEGRPAPPPAALKAAAVSHMEERDKTHDSTHDTGTREVLEITTTVVVPGDVDKFDLDALRKALRDALARIQALEKENAQLREEMLHLGDGTEKDSIVRVLVCLCATFVCRAVSDV